jgi:hypothetical protein
MDSIIHTLIAFHLTRLTSIKVILTAVAGAELLCAGDFDAL